MEENQNTELPVNGLVVLLKENNVSEETALAISPAFTELYDLANEWNSKANEYLKDETLDPEEKAKQAKKARLALVKVRTGIDKKRKELNDADDKRIKDRNNAAKVLTGLVTPTEALLEEVEKKQENEEKERKAALKVERLAKLEPYNVDCTYYDLENMPDPAFDQLLENSRLLHEKKVEDEQKAIKEKELQEKINTRIKKLIELGFNKYGENYVFTFCYLVDHEDETTGFELSFNESKLSDDDSDWNESEKYFIERIQTAKELNKKHQKNIDNRFLAEKQKAERETALLKQQQKEKDEKHNAAIYRQQAAARMNIVLEYTIAHEMTEEDWRDWFKEKDSEYETEENRKFIEKKKKERDDALETAKKKQKAERVNELSKNDFRFEPKSEAWLNEEFKMSILDSTVNDYAPDEWVNGPMAELAGKHYSKRMEAILPDKTKLLKAVESINYSQPDLLNSEEANTINKIIIEKYLTFKNWANSQINTLK